MLFKRKFLSLHSIKRSNMAHSTHLDESAFTFLKSLESNNNRDWFAKNKPKYQLANEHFKALAEEINEGMQKQDNIEKMKLFRIYRDMRFSKNKEPYKNSFSLGFSRETKALRGGYYLHLQPGGNSFVGGGFWQPETADLKRIREEIAADAESLRSIINSASFKKHFGELAGEQLKTAPKGFPKDHPDIDLLTTSGFADQVLNHFHAMRPFFDYMSEVLTTDVNGVSLLKE
jgi:uncharacterized protein (TIGR02453 family)